MLHRGPFPAQLYPILYPEYGCLFGLALCANGVEDRRAMRSDLDHLPPVQQRELERAKTVLLDEFAKAIGGATQPWKKNGKVLKIILFGSYARNDWVDEPTNGYQSDFDLLVIVNHPDLTDVADYWYVAEDLIHRDPEIGRPVNVIVHPLGDVNEALSRGEYFWVDIARDGIVLYELPGTALATPMPLTKDDAFAMACKYDTDWSAKVESAIQGAGFYVSQSQYKDAAFTLHQATERAYCWFLLVKKLYFPRSHNIKFLRSLAEDDDAALIAAWPRASREERRRFELLKRAYVEARYSASYQISAEDLGAIVGSVGDLRDLVTRLCRDHLEERKLLSER